MLNVRRLAGPVGLFSLLLGVVAGIALSRRPAGRKDGHGGLRRVRQAVTVARPRDEVYRFWRQLDNLPRFMQHVASVEVLDERRSHWVATGPLGTRIEWDAEIVDDRPGELICWQSAEGSDVANGGSVRFEDAPGDRGTQIVANFTYDAPGGPLGVAIARVAGEEPAQQASGDLRRLKQILETGEVLQSDGALGGRRLRQRPAQPTTEPVEAGAA